MDLLGYAALGGLERLTIVAGAVIIGYWGYRLYTAEKNAGLIFMGLAVLVLVGALATGGSYLKSVGEGYQLASLPTEAPGPDSPFDDTPTAQNEHVEADPAAPHPAAAVTEVDPPMSPATPVRAYTPEPPIEEVTTAEPAEAPVATAPVEPVLPASEATARDADGSPVRLATGAELGGRIVSVKSENVSLEWSEAPENPEGPGSE